MSLIYYFGLYRRESRPDALARPELSLISQTGKIPRNIWKDVYCGCCCSWRKVGGVLTNGTCRYFCVRRGQGPPNIKNNQ